jgi:hypothetical protein
MAHACGPTNRSLSECRYRYRLQNPAGIKGPYDAGSTSCQQEAGWLAAAAGLHDVLWVLFRTMHVHIASGYPWGGCQQLHLLALQPRESMRYHHGRACIVMRDGVACDATWCPWPHACMWCTAQCTCAGSMLGLLVRGNVYCVFS